MNQTPSLSAEVFSRPTYQGSLWPVRVAGLLLALTFPLIWVGGLVTTHQAGMAVPDWPSTYGYNLLLYPWTTWVFGPWDILVEHGHRLLGVLVGCTAIALVVVVFRTETNRWLRAAAVGALGLVLVQGLLGGARVVMDQRRIAMIHGCVGPAFFAYAAWLTQIYRPRWSTIAFSSRAGSLRTVSLVTALAAYGQLILGANLRHTPPLASTEYFRTLVFFHLLGAAVATFYVSRSWWLSRGVAGAAPWGRTLLALTLCQVALGASTWLVKYYWPDWIVRSSWAMPFTIEAGGLWQSCVVTAHVAMGSLIVATAVVLAWRVRTSVAPLPASTVAPSQQKRRKQKKINFVTGAA